MMSHQTPKEQSGFVSANYRLSGNILLTIGGAVLLTVLLDFILPLIALPGWLPLLGCGLLLVGGYLLYADRVHRRSGLEKNQKSKEKSGHNG